MAAISDQTRRPSPGGLYAADHEHDACGVAMLADVTGKRSHAIVQKAIEACLAHQPELRRTYIARSELLQDLLGSRQSKKQIYFETFMQRNRFATCA